MKEFFVRRRRTLALLAALVTVLAVLGGTLAWFDGSQHRTNIGNSGAGGVFIRMQAPPGPAAPAAACPGSAP